MTSVNESAVCCTEGVLPGHEGSWDDGTAWNLLSPHNRSISLGGRHFTQWSHRRSAVAAEAEKLALGPRVWEYNMQITQPDTAPSGTGSDFVLDRTQDRRWDPNRWEAPLEGSMAYASVQLRFVFSSDFCQSAPLIASNISVGEHLVLRPGRGDDQHQVWAAEFPYGQGVPSRDPTGGPALLHPTHTPNYVMPYQLIYSCTGSDRGAGGGIPSSCAPSAPARIRLRGNTRVTVTVTHVCLYVCPFDSRCHLTRA